MQSKAEIRERIRKMRSELTRQWVCKHSTAVCSRLAALPQTSRADTVCLYLALPKEVDLAPLIYLCQSRGQRVLAPAYRKESNDYGFKELHPDSKTVAALWNVPEPLTDKWALPQGKTCILVPGVAFADDGTRTGHGKGYYDRLLTETEPLEKAARIGVCFDFQRFPTLPREPWDIPMDMVVSESRITGATNNLTDKQQQQ